MTEGREMHVTDDELRQEAARRGMTVVDAARWAQISELDPIR